MEDNGITTTSHPGDDDNHTTNESLRINSSSAVSQQNENNSKAHKGSFMSQIRKRLSFHKKAKSKHSSNSNDNGTQIGHKESISSAPVNTTKHSSNSSNEIIKQENRFSAIRRSFGKGKQKENSSNKDITNEDITEVKQISNVTPNEGRPNSMFIANSQPPRNWVLASYGWYWGPLSRSEATHRLRHQDDGSFLVRDSEGDPNKFTLSFKGAGQIFHNRILKNEDKYAFLPDEGFDSIPELIADAMRRSATSAYCFSRSTDVAPATPVATNPNDCQTPLDNAPNGINSNVNSHHKHEVRLLKSVSRYSESPRSLFYLCRFMIRQYTRFQDLGSIVSKPEVLLYLQDHKYNL